ncbi:hypothetical protein WJX84_010043 [Apatococcus fuscideae]|uniref:Ketosynthase family 3 (KS3) domain-containing protein n=1 Tax=Apatococcus fuscideae TaxID=2026836 RepID=A0AAW1T615_9CHLO
MVVVDTFSGRFAEPSDGGGQSLDTCRVTPFQRWDVDATLAHVSHRPGARFGRFLDHVEDFDAAAYGISPTEALVLDPQQRLMLQDAWNVFGHRKQQRPEAVTAGVPAADQTAVVAALSFWDYSLLYDGTAGEAYRATGRCFSVAAGRISYVYGLKGPAVSLDTACSSTLSATSLASSMLWGGRCKRGLVTASLLTLDPATISMLTAANMLAPDGRCKTLDASADGYVRGEAVVSMGLSLRDAGDVWGAAGVVLGTAINQDGRSSSLTAPNGPSQQQVIRLALQDARVVPADLAALEMHGTGTPLGDPIEVGAAATVLSEGRAFHGHDLLGLSAVKNVLGHSEPAAGAAGLHRCMQRCAPITSLQPFSLTCPIRRRLN